MLMALQLHQCPMVTLLKLIMRKRIKLTATQLLTQVAAPTAVEVQYISGNYFYMPGR